MSVPAADSVAKEIANRFKQTYEEGYIRKDPKLVGSLFASDSIFQFSGSPTLTSQSAVVQFYTKVFHSFAEGRVIFHNEGYLIDKTADLLHPGLVVGYGRAERKWRLQSSSTFKEIEWQYSFTVIKEGEDWKIRVFTVCPYASSAPPIS